MRHNGHGRPWVEAPPELIELARADREAFGQLYDLYVNRVYRFCLAHTATIEQAEDLTEETFLRALTALTRPAGRKGRYEDLGIPFSSWLLRIAANVQHDFWRRRHVTVYSPTSVEDGRECEPPGDRAIDVRQVDLAAQVESWERAAHLHACLQLLPCDYRKALQLRYWEERTWDDVGGRMGRTAGAAKKIGRRALALLAVLVREDQLHAQPSPLQFPVSVLRYSTLSMQSY